MSNDILRNVKQFTRNSVRMLAGMSVLTIAVAVGCGDATYVILMFLIMSTMFYLLTSSLILKIVKVVVYERE